MKEMPGRSRSLSWGLVLLYEDRDIIVVDKPAGLLSIANWGERDKTVYRILYEYLRKKGEKRRPAVVHRLDRDTSGVMIFAKSEQVKKKLMDNWDALVTERRYVAVVEGSMDAWRRDGKTEGVINAPLGEGPAGKVVVTETGRHAVTRWKLLRGFSKKGSFYSLLSLELETGRRNQIRAHLAWIGRPVAGDKKYGAQTGPFKRLCLHAEKIAFTHPGSGNLMEFEVPAPWTGQDKDGPKDSRNSYT
jgi:23S rRNA pseudouridine1911/1915/1917 synthase